VTLTLNTQDGYEHVWEEFGYISTADDVEPGSTSHVLNVGGGHPHQWQAVHNVPAPTVTVNGGGSGPFLSEQIIPISHFRGQTETDQCTAAGCNYPGGTLTESTRLFSWTQNGSGTFGRMNGTQFVATSDPALITHYKCPTVQAATSVTLTANADDPHNAGESGPFFNDNLSPGNKTFTVNPLPPHVHQWEVNHNLGTPSVTVTPGTQRAGRLVEVSASVSSPETDQCLAAGCPFPGGLANNNARITAWSDNGGGGQFGREVGGNFVA
jgi:hypothetical protein